MEELRYWIWLNSIDGVGPVITKKLLNSFKTPKAVWNAQLNELVSIEGINDKLAKQIFLNKDINRIDDEVNRINLNQAKVVTVNDQLYPNLLKMIYAPPPLLYYKGTITSSENMVSIVGARSATHYGLKVAYEFGKLLAKSGITVVSGMARGIDAAAHRGALDGGGRTIAVLGCGVDIIYPSENKELMNEIIKNGAVISEFPIGTIPDSRNFPQRNRIVSGLSHGTLVVEAQKRSGSLITADLALSQNREVFAIPSQVFNKFGEGTNNLIKQGAKITTCIEDILEELNIINNNKQVAMNEEVKYNLGNDEKVIYSNISNLPIHLEHIMKNTGFTIDKLNTIITMLELKGIIKQLPGKQFIRN